MADRRVLFERSDFRAREVAKRTRSATWPIAPGKLLRVGQSVLMDRNGTGRPHKGIDLFAEPGTPVLAASAGDVLRVIDGQAREGQRMQRAGLFLDIRGVDGLIYRYLHLGDASVQPGQRIAQATVLGHVASAHQSGTGQASHLHFEVRRSDYDWRRKDYGEPVDPLSVLPARAV